MGATNLERPDQREVATKANQNCQEYQRLPSHSEQYERLRYLPARGITIFG